MTEVTGWRRHRRTLEALVVLAALQAAAVGVFLLREHGKGSEAAPTFRQERVRGLLPLPSVALVRPDDRVVIAQELRGRPILLHFWATWCPPCREELPGLLELQRALPEVRVVAVSVDSDWASVDAFFGGSIPAEIFREPTGAMAKAYDLGALPDTFLIDAEGAARVRFGGARDWRSEGARAALRTAVAELSDTSSVRRER